MTQRQSGRTTRMLAEAGRLAKDGRAVYVIAANEVERRRLQSMLPNDSPVKVETGSSPGNFDWDQLALRGAHPNCEVLVDHYAIEMRYSRILNELHRYDAQ